MLGCARWSRDPRAESRERLIETLALSKAIKDEGLSAVSGYHQAGNAAQAEARVVIAFEPHAGPESLMHSSTRPQGPSRFKRGSRS